MVQGLISLSSPSNTCNLDGSLPSDLIMLTKASQNDLIISGKPIMASSPGIAHTMKLTSALISFPSCMNAKGITKFSLTSIIVLLSPRRTTPGLATRKGYSSTRFESTMSLLIYDECRAPESNKTLLNDKRSPVSSLNVPCLCTLLETLLPGPRVASRSCDRSVSSKRRSPTADD